MRNNGDVRKSPTKVLLSKQVEEEQIMDVDQEVEETGLQQMMEFMPEIMPDESASNQEEIKHDAEERECEFVKRMIERAYADKRFEDVEVITELANGRR